MNRWKFSFLFALTFLLSCSPADFQKVMDTLGQGTLTDADISSGLKEALRIGISKGADELSQVDGYFKSPYKILLPPEARKVTERLQKIPGFTQVENIILEKINRGAEEAAKRAKPIFVSAIRQMTFQDAMNILMGTENAATNYLENSTRVQLYNEFSPIVVESLDKFNARKYWSDAINAYNKIPFIEKANPSLDDYVVNEALNGLFSMVEKEEKNIRENVSARTSELLRKVFAKQDKGS